MPFIISFRAMPCLPGFDDFQPILPWRAVRRDMPVERLPVILNSLHKSATFVSFWPMAATARRSFAAVILKAHRLFVRRREPMQGQLSLCDQVALEFR